MVGVVLVIIISLIVATLLVIEIVGLVRDLKKRKQKKLDNKKSSIYLDDETDNKN